MSRKIVHSPIYKLSSQNKLPYSFLRSIICNYDFHFIGPKAASVQKLGCQFMCSCECVVSSVCWRPEPRGLETSGQRTNCYTKKLFFFLFEWSKNLLGFYFIWTWGSIFVNQLTVYGGGRGVSRGRVCGSSCWHWGQMVIIWYWSSFPHTSRNSVSPICGVLTMYRTCNWDSAPYLTLSNDQLYSGRTGQVRNARVGGRVLGVKDKNPWGSDSFNLI